ncbi:MAG: OsmC family peroxiredoxin, partial [Gemmatimonadales bacterium]
NAAGRMAMAVVTLRPDATFSGDRRPSREELDAMHHQAHDLCLIANSVTSEVRVEPVVPA